MHLSIIIPLAIDETQGQHLLTQLLLQKQALGYFDAMNQQIEIIIVGDMKQKVCEHCATMLPAADSRAAALNAGATAAVGRYLWFVHADTHLPKYALMKVMRIAQTTNLSALYYCDLSFLPDATPLMLLNKYGVWLRSHILKTPFGDQALLIQKTLFVSLDCYPTNLSYGEDHALVIAARQAGVSICYAGFCVMTSARKYAHNGWLRTTCLHLALTLKQYWCSRKRIDGNKHE